MPPVGAVSLISARRPRPPFSATRPTPCQPSGEHDRARVHADRRFGPLLPGLPSRLDARGRRASATQGLRRPVFARRWIAALRVRARALVLAAGAAATAPGQAAIPAQRDADSSSAAAPSSARGSRPIAGGACATRSSMAWPSTGATWFWARSRSWPQSTEDSVRRSPRRARGPHEEAFRQLKTSFSGPTASSRTRSILDLTKRVHRASGLRSTNGTPGLSSLGSSERPDRTMSPLLPTTPAGPRDGLCRATVGSRGGEQFIRLLDSDGCSVGATIHDTGHALRLWQEHQRKDRDACVTVSEASLFGGALQGAYRASRPARGPCDCASVMHY